MTAKYKRFLIGFSVLTALAGFVTVVGYHFGSKPYHDVIFETNTLLVLLFIGSSKPPPRAVVIVP
ncbi:hypothetical protein ACODM8_01640 [Vibrio ostreicida]|uniref:hypothetical protein n=1 Tax=Vibrio ostreicida TaxID=526588 RepID=UPI003B5BBF1E